MDFNDIYNEHKDYVFNVCYRLTKDKDDAEDCSQCVWTRVYTKLHTFRGDSDIKTWLYAIAKNRYLTQLRTNVDFNTDVEDCTSQTPESITSDRELISLAEETIQDDYYDILRDYLYNDEADYEDLSKKYNIPIGSIRSRIYRARRKLRRRMDNGY